MTLEEWLIEAYTWGTGLAAIGLLIWLLIILINNLPREKECSNEDNLEV